MYSFVLLLQHFVYFEPEDCNYVERVHDECEGEVGSHDPEKACRVAEGPEEDAEDVERTDHVEVRGGHQDDGDRSLHVM